MKGYSNLFIRLLAGVMILLILSCSKDEAPVTDSGKIKTDKPVFVLKNTIPVTGGILEVKGTQTPLEGLQIEVPADSYLQSQEFSISYANITSHELGEYFHPVAPLIEITNGGVYSEKVVKLKIPVQSNPGYYRMACYYNRQSGELEPITIVRSTDQFLEVAVRHFSLIAITEIKTDLIIEGGGYASFFDPLENGWSFKNNGTYPESQGICAGMSIGAAYYFKNFGATVKLFNYFENDQLWFRTNDLWEDDAKGLRFATAIHQVQELFWTSNNASIIEIIDAAEEDRFWNLLYSMLIKNQPQLIYLASTKSDTAHMMIAYAYTINSSGATISVYDPNFSGITKLLEFDLSTKTFKPYYSAANAIAVEQGLFNLYDKIAYLPLSTVISDDEMNFLWQKVQNNTIGDGTFPSYKIYATPKNPEFAKVELNIADNSFQNTIPFDEFDFEIAGIDAGYQLKLEALSFLPGFGLERVNPAQTIKMENKDTLIGLYLKGTPPGEPYEKWMGFEWFKIKLSDIWIEPSDTTVGVNSEIRFLARNNGSAPKRAKYEWDFGDKNIESTTDTFITYAYKEVGEYEVSLTVTNLDNQKEIAKLTSKVTVTIWPRIAITIKGMDVTPPSTIKASDGSDIPAIAWANKSIATAPALNWNKNEFDVDFTYNLFPGVYTCTIHGTLADDGKKITFLSAIYTGIAYGGDWTYQAAIVLQNFPVEEYLPGAIIGKTLEGKEAQTKVTQLTWKQTVKDNQGNTSEITLQSVDWNSNQTQLSVFFYDR